MEEQLQPTSRHRIVTPGSVGDLVNTGRVLTRLSRGRAWPRPRVGRSPPPPNGRPLVVVGSARARLWPLPICGPLGEGAVDG